MTLRHIADISGGTDIAELAHSTESPFFGPSSWVLRFHFIPHMFSIPIENTNKLIRQYIPKDTDFSSLSGDYIFFVQTELNLLPRKKLDYSPPKQKFLLSLHNGVALRG